MAFRYFTADSGVVVRDIAFEEHTRICSRFHDHAGCCRDMVPSRWRRTLRKGNPGFQEADHRVSRRWVVSIDEVERCSERCIFAHEVIPHPIPRTRCGVPNEEELSDCFAVAQDGEWTVEIAPRAKTSIEDFTISQESLVDGGKWIFKGFWNKKFGAICKLPTP